MKKIMNKKSFLKFLHSIGEHDAARTFRNVNCTNEFIPSTNPPLWNAIESEKAAWYLFTSCLWSKSDSYVMLVELHNRLKAMTEQTVATARQNERNAKELKKLNKLSVKLAKKENREIREKLEKAKIVSVVCVVTMEDGVPQHMLAYNDDGRGNAEAEKVFTKYCLQHKANKEDVEVYIEDGFFQDGLFTMALIHSL